MAAYLPPNGTYWLLNRQRTVFELVDDHLIICISQLHISYAVYVSGSGVLLESAEQLKAAAFRLDIKLATT